MPQSPILKISSQPVIQENANFINHDESFTDTFSQAAEMPKVPEFKPASVV
jgi:hypothetical protein